MKHLGKWTFPIVIVLLLVIAIDFNMSWRNWSAPGGLSLLTVDIILVGLLLLFIILSIIKNRR